MNGLNYLIEMINNILKDKKKLYLLITFIILLIISILTPISGDDYGNYISTDGTIKSAINLAISYYNGLEGRFVGRILIMYTTYHKLIWNILTPILFILLISSIFKFLNKTISCLILLLGLLLVNTDMFAQSYTWLAGSITYLYPTCLTLFYFITIYRKHNNYRFYNYISLIILSIIIPMFVENIGCIFVLGNIIILVYYIIKDKKINKLYLINTILSSIFLLVMLKSPGSASRSLTENIDFNNLSTINKVIYNIKNFNSYVFFKNSIMIIITLIPMIYYIIKKHKKSYAIIFSIIPILSIINNIYYIMPMKFSFLQNLNIINTSNNLYMIYWIIYIIVLILSINYIVIDKKEKNFILFLLMIGLLSSLIMLILPTWGDRITLYSTITLIIIGTILIDKIIKKEYYIYKYLKIVYALTSIYLIIVFILINKLTIYREKYIKEQLDNNINTIEIIRNPIMYVWNNNPQSDYFVKTYKSYQNIDKEKEIKIVQLSYKEYLNIILER